MVSEIHHSLALEDEYDKKEAYKTVSGEKEPYEDCLVKINQLSLEKRLLHYVITHCVMNKSGNYTYANKSEQYIMVLTLNSRHFNVPYLIMKRMENVVNKKSTPIPYASNMSKLICAYTIYPLNNEEKFKPHEIGMNTLSHLGYEKYENAWTWKCGRRTLGPHPQKEDVEMQEHKENPLNSPLAPTHEEPEATYELTYMCSRFF